MKAPLDNNIVRDILCVESFYVHNNSIIENIIHLKQEECKFN